MVQYMDEFYNYLDYADHVICHDDYVIGKAIETGNYYNVPEWSSADSQSWF